MKVISCKFLVTFHVFINSYTCYKESYFDKNLLHSSKGHPKLNFNSLLIPKIDLTENIGEGVTK